MIVEIQTVKPIVIDTNHQSLTESEQARLSLVITPYRRRTLEPGIHDIKPTKRNLLAQMLFGIAGWTVHVLDHDNGELYTLHKAVNTVRSTIIPEPTITRLEPGEYYPVGDISRRGKIETDRIVANISDMTSDDTTAFTPDKEPIFSH